MIKMNRVLLLVILISCFASAGALADSGVNVVQNGDFEAGNTSFTTTYSHDPIASAAGVYFVGSNPNSFSPSFPSSLHDHTTGSGLMLMANGGTASSGLFLPPSVVATASGSA